MQSVGRGGTVGRQMPLGTTPQDGVLPPRLSDSEGNRMNLNELIAAHKSGRSYEELARDCGGVMTSQRLQQIATTAPKAFPSADTLRGLAKGLRVSESVVVLAVAESLGLDVSRAVPRLVELLPATALTITDRQSAAIAEVIRSFTETKAGAGDDRDAAPNTTVTDLSERRPRVPEKRVARRPPKE